MLTCWYLHVDMHCAQLQLFRNMKQKFKNAFTKKLLKKTLEKSPFKYLVFPKRSVWGFSNGIVYLLKNVI